MLKSIDELDIVLQDWTDINERSHAGEILFSVGLSGSIGWIDTTEPNPHTTGCKTAMLANLYEPCGSPLIIFESINKSDVTMTIILLMAVLDRLHTLKYDYVEIKDPTPSINKAIDELIKNYELEDKQIDRKVKDILGINLHPTRSLAPTINSTAVL